MAMIVAEMFADDRNREPAPPAIHDVLDLPDVVDD
jgi:hypothetical protein